MMALEADSGTKPAKDGFSALPLPLIADAPFLDAASATINAALPSFGDTAVPSAAQNLNLTSMQLVS